MKKYSGNKVSTAIFISGRGTNLKSLISFSHKKISPIKIDLVFSNKRKASGLKLAKEKKIKILLLNEKFFYNSERKLVKILNEKNIKLICLAGFMKILKDLREELLIYIRHYYPNIKDLTLTKGYLKKKRIILDVRCIL